MSGIALPPKPTWRPVSPPRSPDVSCTHRSVACEYPTASAACSSGQPDGAHRLRPRAPRYEARARLVAVPPRPALPRILERHKKKHLHGDERIGRWIRLRIPQDRNPARNRSIAASSCGSSSNGAWPRPGTVSDCRCGFSRRIRSSIFGLGMAARAAWRARGRLRRTPRAETPVAPLRVRPAHAHASSEQPQPRPRARQGTDARARAGIR